MSAIRIKQRPTESIFEALERVFGELIAEDEELAKCRNASSANNDRLFAAAAKAGIPYAWRDTPALLAEEILVLRDKIKYARVILS